LNRPDKMNSLTPKMQQELMHAMDDIEGDDAITVVIITGAGRSFCAGFDVTSILGDISAISIDDLPKIVNSGKIYIAAVNGFALAQGFQIATACDFRIASEKAKFGGIGVLINEVCIYCVFTLGKIVGSQKANEILFTGEIFDGTEAARIGYAMKVVPHDKLMEEALAMASRIKDNAPASLKFTKQALRRGEYTEDERFWLKKVTAKLAVMEDTKEGFKAFMEKRKPVFKGK
jgi:enoyl-CoA hydratase